MTPAVVAYGFLVAVLFGLAALAAERAFAIRSWPRRGLWAASLIASLAVPVLALLVPDHDRQVVSDTRQLSAPAPIETHAAKAAADGTTAVVVANVADKSGIRDVLWSRLPDLDGLLKTIWIACSVGLFGLYCAAWIGLAHAARHWPREWVGGESVRVADAVGPAVFGYFRPEIVVPRWLLREPPAIRAMVLAHEREHIAARDPLLLLIALLLIALTPWNLPLWWQLRRLRFAIEVDCDARVLRRGADVRAYGDALLTISQQRSLALLGAMSITAPVSQLERRVRIMTSLRPQRGRWLMGFAAILCFACVAVATQLQTPELPGDNPLTKPPPQDWSPYLPIAEGAARAAHGDLFEGRFSGTVELIVDLNRDGVVLEILKRKLPAGPITEESYATSNYRESDWDVTIHDAWHHPGAGGLKFVGWFGPQRTNGLYIAYRVLKWPHDPTRSAEIVEAQVAARYPEFYRHYSPAMADISKAKLLTVFMNDDGTIDRAQLIDGTVNADDDGRNALERFRQLGLTPEQLSHRGRITNWERWGWRDAYQSAPLLRVDYAWTRRPEDPPDESLQSHDVFHQVWNLLQDEQQNQAPDHAFLMRYFPDVWQDGGSLDNLWILLDRLGNVLDSGRTLEMPHAYRKELEARYPGTKIGEGRYTGVKAKNGKNASLAYFWLAADSPVISLPHSNPSQP
jgi:hypothetical protein